MSDSRVCFEVCLPRKLHERLHADFWVMRDVYKEFSVYLSKVLEDGLTLCKWRKKWGAEK